jgi:lipopolysaccharide biosynthesis regulator YciM
VDSDTIETHFALGNLFRRRGEVNRAIQIHHNLFERKELPRRYREQALRALAEDYLKAGLLDRAEEYLKQLADRPAYRREALERLVLIYEQEREWQQAIAMRDRLADETHTGRSPVVAHYFCELAQKALADGDEEQAREYLRRARSADRDNLRGAILRAEIAAGDGDYRLASRLYRKVMERDPGFAPLTLPALRRCHAAMGDQAGLDRILSAMVAARPGLKAGLAYAAIVDEEFDDPVTRECIVDFIRRNPMIRELMGTLRPDSAGDGEDDQGLRRITRALRMLAASNPSYRCENCGFSGKVLHWQCPTCKNWDSTRPTASFHFEASLGVPRLAR